jgi:hypothetical protein
MLLQLNEALRDRVQFGRDASSAPDCFQDSVADGLHLRVFEGTSKDSALPFHGPVADGFVDQKVEESVICGGYGTPASSLSAGSLRASSFAS